MKTTFLLLALLFAACQFTERDPVKDALSTEGRTANIIYVIPATSACPDSLEFTKAETALQNQIDYAKDAILVGLVNKANLDSFLFAQQSAYDSALSRLKASPRTPGFSLIRYTVNREPDTLTAVLDPAFRVVWPR